VDTPFWLDELDFPGAKKLAAIACIPYGIQKAKDCPNGFFIRVDMKFGSGEASHRGQS
jgi:hypothetical protein